MAYGFAPPQSSTDVYKAKVSSTDLLKDRFENQVSSALKKVKGQLQELDGLPSIEELAKKEQHNEVSCATPEVNLLATSAVTNLTSTTSSNPPPSPKRGFGFGQASHPAAFSIQEKAPSREKEKY